MKEVGLNSIRDLSADVIIVGSGAGGAVTAKELAENGLDVLVFEKGERLTKYEFNQTESAMLPRLYEESGMRSTIDQSVIILHGKGVGGTTLVNNNICFRAPESILDAWAHLGIEGISSNDMSPFYEKVEKEISVSLIQEGEVSRNDQIFLRGARQLGLEAHRFNHNRKGCIGCGFCYCGCAYDRKQNMALTYIPKSEAAGARIIPNTEVQHLTIEGAKVAEVMAWRRDPVSGQIQEQIRARAPVFILAGGGISTPALLLKSGFHKLNRNIGHHLSLHPIFAHIGLMPHPVRFYEGIPQCAYVNRLDRHGGGYILEGIGAHPVLTSFVIPSFGRNHREILENYERFTAHYVMVKDSPSGSVQVSRNGSIRVHYSLQPRDQESLREGTKLSLRIYFAAGASKVYLNHVDAPAISSPREIDPLVDRLRMEPNRFVLYSAHQMASCRMGLSPRTSVTNSYGKVHGMDNLYIADASLFPTSLGYNPQLTIMALAARNALHLLQTRKWISC